MAQDLTYRPEVDGLRAIAVVSVVLFHLDARLAPGGFTGVDIFFVISGFLITSLIAKAATEGRFSFRDFYLRRIRRIAPAYFVVVLATLAAGCALMLPADLAQLARSASWSALSLPNVFFWLNIDTGYFATDSRQLPLLHLWSLGVEEQFYLLWPAVLLACLHRLPGRWLPWLLAVPVAASFAHAQQQSAIDPAYAYYMLPTRAGELGIGAILALLPAVRQARKDGGVIHELWAVAGLCLMLWGVLALDGTSRFPGWNALLPCLGAALVIFADSRRRCAALAPLRWPPVVGIGLVSYSLYLWHWPVLAFIRYLGIQMGPLRMVAVLALILALASASYWLIERKARKLRWRGMAQATLLFAVPAALLLGASLFIARHADQVAGIFGESTVERAEKLLLAQTAPAYEFPYNCQLGEQFDPGVLQRPQCVHGKGSTTAPDVLLWGDSHAAHYIGVLGAIVEKNGLAMRNASLSTCPPVLGERDDYGMATYQQPCAQFRQLVRSHIDDYPVIALGAQWSVHAGKAHFAGEFEQTVARLSGSGKSVVLLAEVPPFPGYDRNCEVRNLRHALVDCVAAAERKDNGTEASNAYLRQLAAKYPRVYVLDLHNLVCADGSCSPYLEGRQVYFDSSHLSMEGSWTLGRRLLAAGLDIPPPLTPKR